MVPRTGLTSNAPTHAIPGGSDLHILVVASDAKCRYALSDQLLDAGLSITLASTYGVVEVLLGGEAPFDVMITTQSTEESAVFGLPQLARSVDADLPILVIDPDTLSATAVVEMVRDALVRWPLREPGARILH